MLRIASVLLVAVLLTTCIISGAFAKYVTTANGADQAQVAKFGVKIAINDDFEIFDTKYDAGAADDAFTVVTNSVATDNTANRVAPGTKDSMSFTITGTPETSVNVAVTFAEDNNAIQLAKDQAISLPAGAYANSEYTATPATTYEPVRFYFGTTAIGADTTYTLTLAELQATMAETLNKNYTPNNTLDVTYYIGWEWAFTDAGDANKDFYDTYLAQQTPLQVEKFAFTVTVTQID